MPRTRKGNEPVSQDLAALRGTFDELNSITVEWERGGDEQRLAELADEITHTLLLLPRDLLDVAMKFRRLETGRVLELGNRTGRGEERGSP
jgi:hypothetical protein